MRLDKERTSKVRPLQVQALVGDSLGDGSVDPDQQSPSFDLDHAREWAAQ